MFLCWFFFSMLFCFLRLFLRWAWGSFLFQRAGWRSGRSRAGKVGPPAVRATAAQRLKIEIRPGAMFIVCLLFFNNQTAQPRSEAHEMHYIRLMRPPSLDESGRLKLVLTITTDLGDSFLCPDDPVPISVYAYNSTSALGPNADDKLRIDQGKTLWIAGLRVLKLDLPIPLKALQRLTAEAKRDNGSTRIRIVASRDLADPPYAAEIPFDTTGRILGLSVICPQPGYEPCYAATRELAMHNKGTSGILEIDEEIGESIDRHVWDAGVVTTGLLADICDVNGTGTRWSKMPLLRRLVCPAMPKRSLDVIELGCGVGILGIGIARALLSVYSRTKPQMKPADGAENSTDSSDPAASDDSCRQSIPLGSVLLTDLPDAEEMTRSNIGSLTHQMKSINAGHMPLDFESLDWEDGKVGVLGPKAGSTSWDLVIISDCTYNVDMLSALIKTVSALHKSSVNLGDAGPMVMLATKPRHPSETALFDLMKADDWSILESASQSLPVLGMDNKEAVEVYLLGKSSEQVSSDNGSAKRGVKRQKVA